MDIDQLHEQHRTIVEKMYSKEADDYDAIPTLIVALGEVVNVLVLHGEGSPLDMAANAVGMFRKHGTEPDTISFMSPVWRKDTEGNRTGEGVMLVTESTTERRATMYSVTREPLTLTEDPEASEVRSRINLLYQPTKTEH